MPPSASEFLLTASMTWSDLELFRPAWWYESAAKFELILQNSNSSSRQGARDFQAVGVGRSGESPRSFRSAQSIRRSFTGQKTPCRSPARIAVRQNRESVDSCRRATG